MSIRLTKSWGEPPCDSYVSTTLRVGLNRTLGVSYPQLIANSSRIHREFIREVYICLFLRY
jgi:hypothetical protein